MAKATCAAAFACSAAACLRVASRIKMRSGQPFWNPTDRPISKPHDDTAPAAWASVCGQKRDAWRLCIGVLLCGLCRRHKGRRVLAWLGTREWGGRKGLRCWGPLNIMARRRCWLAMQFSRHSCASKLHLRNPVDTGLYLLCWPCARTEPSEPAEGGRFLEAARPSPAGVDGEPRGGVGVVPFTLLVWSPSLSLSGSLSHVPPMPDCLDGWGECCPSIAAL